MHGDTDVGLQISFVLVLRLHRQLQLSLSLQAGPAMPAPQASLPVCCVCGGAETAGFEISISFPPPINRGFFLVGRPGAGLTCVEAVGCADTRKLMADSRSCSSED